MKVRIALLALAFFASAPFAAEPAKKAPSPAQLAQQEKMKTCNAEAGKKALKGDERKKFMSECLSAKKAEAAAPAAQAAPATPATPATPAAPAASQQDKMKTCNAEAAKQALKGDERKKFMSARFNDMIASNQHLSMAQQAELLDKAFLEWKGDYEQVDDICVVGLAV